MTDLGELFKAAADNKAKAHEGLSTCLLCPEKWEWAVSSAYGNLLLCKSCSQVVFSFLAARLQGDQKMKVLVVNKPGPADN